MGGRNLPFSTYFLNLIFKKSAHLKFSFHFIYGNPLLKCATSMLSSRGLGSLALWYFVFLLKTITFIYKDTCARISHILQKIFKIFKFPFIVASFSSLWWKESALTNVWPASIAPRSVKSSFSKSTLLSNPPSHF